MLTLKSFPAIEISEKQCICIILSKTVQLQHKTLLYVAAERGDAEAARIIIAAGANPNLR